MIRDIMLMDFPPPQQSSVEDTATTTAIVSQTQIPPSTIAAVVEKSPPPLHLRPRKRRLPTPDEVSKTANVVATVVPTTTIALAPTIAVPLSEATSSKVQKTVSSTTRLNEEQMKVVLEIVVDNITKRNLIGAMEVNAANAMNSDTTIVMSACELWHEIMKYTIIHRVCCEVAKRKLTPVTIHTLCALLLEVTCSLAK
jgi:hypothetical protein